MRKFVAIAFVVAFFFSFAFFSGQPSAGERLGSALGGAILLAFVGWLVARKGGYRWAAASMAVFASLAWIGR